MGYRNGLRIRVYGSEGSAEWVQMDPEVLRMSDSAGRISLVDRTSGENRVAHHDRYCRFKAGHPAGFIEAFANYYADIAANLRGEETAYAAGAETALRGLNFLQKTQHSACSASRITL
jgi:predicted dehydrogenase